MDAYLDWTPGEPIEEEWENGLVFLCRLNKYASTWKYDSDKAKYAFTKFSEHRARAMEQLRHLPTFKVTTSEKGGKRTKTIHPMHGYQKGDVLGWKTFGDHAQLVVTTPKNMYWVKDLRGDPELTELGEIMELPRTLKCGKDIFKNFFWFMDSWGKVPNALRKCVEVLIPKYREVLEKAKPQFEECKVKEFTKKWEDIQVALLRRELGEVGGGEEWKGGFRVYLYEKFKAFFEQQISDAQTIEAIPLLQPEDFTKKGRFYGTNFDKKGYDNYMEKNRETVKAKNAARDARVYNKRLLDHLTTEFSNSEELGNGIKAQIPRGARGLIFDTHALGLELEAFRTKYTTWWGMDYDLEQAGVAAYKAVKKDLNIDSEVWAKARAEAFDRRKGYFKQDLFLQANRKAGELKGQWAKYWHPFALGALDLEYENEQYKAWLRTNKETLKLIAYGRPKVLAMLEGLVAPEDVAVDLPGLMGMNPVGGLRGVVLRF